MIICDDAGWGKIKVSGENVSWGDRLSYLDDVPFALLDAFIESCKKHKPAAVRFDAEGYEYILVIEWTHMYVIYQDYSFLRQMGMKPAESELVDVKVDCDALARELIADIRGDVEAWAGFSCDCREEDVPARCEALLKMCDELESLLDSAGHVLALQSMHDELESMFPSADCVPSDGGEK